MDALHDPLVGCAGAMAPEQFDLNMIERVDIGGAKFGKGGGVTSNRDSSLTTQRSIHSAICWHSNAYFSLFSSLFFFGPPNSFQVGRGRRVVRIVEQP
jgi:hypothetical protein